MHEIDRIEKIEYYPNGQIKTRGDNYKKSGKKIGIWIEYFENSHIKSIGTYGTNKNWLNNNGNKEGEWKDYYENGQLKRIGTYHNSTEPIGIWLEYYDNGNLKSVGSYRNGWYTKNGKWEYFYENGNIKKVEYYRKKTFSNSCYPEGMWKTYYDNGEKKAIEIYKKGKAVGEWFEYYKSGKIKSFANYSKKIKIKKGVGNNKYEHNILWKFLNENGDIVSLQYFAKNWYDSPYGGRGNRNGNYQSFYKNGNLRMEGVCSENIKKGEWKYYSENGKLIENVRTWLKPEEKITE